MLIVFKSLFSKMSNSIVSSGLAKVNGRPGEEKNFYHQFSIEKYSSLPRDTFKTYVERHVTRRKLSLKLIGYCRQSSYTDSEVVFTLLPAVAWVLKSQFAPGYMHLNICFEGVSEKRGIFLNGKLAIEVFFLSRPAIDFSYYWALLGLTAYLAFLGLKRPYFAFVN